MAIIAAAGVANPQPAAPGCLQNLDDQLVNGAAQKLLHSPAAVGLDQRLVAEVGDAVLDEVVALHGDARPQASDAAVVEQAHVWVEHCAARRAAWGQRSRR